MTLSVVLFALLVRWAETGAAQQPLSIEETLTALGKGHTLGRATAPVNIVEFSDFQCSFCRKFWADTFPKLKDTYIKQDKVRFTYRHFAILGKFSEQAGMAAECSGEQGKFWEYHDKLFASREDWHLRSRNSSDTQGNWGSKRRISNSA